MTLLIRITRRDFLLHLGVGTGSLVFGSCFTQLASIKSSFRNGIPVTPFVAIKPGSGDIIVVSHRSEMGQGIKSSLVAVLVDEMEADWNRVVLRQADANSYSYGIPFPFPVPEAQELVPSAEAQITDSSRSMALYFQPMRLFGAAIRIVMIRAAARRWRIDPNELQAREHRVIHTASGRSVDYRFLLLDASRVAVPTIDEATAALKPPHEWRFLTRHMPFYDAPDIVRGTAVYGGDVHLKAMLTASIERCPVANGRLVEFDPKPALAVPGVRKVMRVLAADAPTGGVGAGLTPHAGVAVLATNTWAAMKGRAALRSTIKWDHGTNRDHDSRAQRVELETAATSPGKRVRWKGDVDAAFAGAVKTVEARYYVPHLAQVPMEPPVAVVLFKDGRVEAWAPTQNPDATQQAIGRAVFNIPPSQVNDAAVTQHIRQNVTLHVTLLGGGFGRKLHPDFAVEAAHLARQNPGIPIRVQWTREDDIRFSYYNGASSQYFKAAIDAEGRPAAWLQRSAFTSLAGTFTSEWTDDNPYPYGASFERAEGLEDMPFNVPHLRIENCPARNHVRVGCMRSGANIYHAFGIGCFADELAIAAGRDSKDYLLELIGDGHVLPLRQEGVEQFYNNGFPLDAINVPVGGRLVEILEGYPPDTRRLRAVVERVAKDSGWDQKKGKLPKGRGLGIAAHRSRLSYVALAIEVSFNEAGEVTIHDVYAAIDCGFAVNLDRLTAQMEGGIIYGLSLALFGEITIENGAVTQKDFVDYPVWRITKTPSIRVSILPSSEPPTGVGEPPTPVVAPALANAIVAAGGPRLRDIPFSKKIAIAGYGAAMP